MELHKHKHIAAVIKSIRYIDNHKGFKADEKHALYNYIFSFDRKGM